MKNKVLLILILILAFCLRLAGFNWDSGFHFHPDERMLIMVAERITFWTQLNPDFFNYGSLPIYLLRGTSQLLDLIFNSTLANYDGMLFVGRSLSTIADLIVVFLIYHISFHISHKKTIALWSSFFYAIAFFPIQNSHFFIVDTFLNLFSTLLMYLLLMYRDQPSYKKVCMIGIVFAAALTSKISAVIFLPVIGLTFILPFEKHENIFQKIFHLFQRKPTKIRPYILYSLFNILLFSLCTLIFGFLFMPYAFIEYIRFLSDISQQVKMNSDAYIFPYTLQYVGTLPYWYYIKNIFLWGLGPVISTLAIIGIIVCIRKYLPYFPSLPRRGIEGVASFTIFLLFYLIYFIIIGKSAVKFMRYMLPLYPFFAIMAGYGVYVILNFVQNRTIHVIPSELVRSEVEGVEGSTFISRFRITSEMTMIIVLPTLLWTFMFLNIYSTQNTRIQATEWINQFIPYGSTLATEHWDDRVPIYDPGNYQYEELTLYDIPDDDQKWKIINQKIDRSDYIVIASNRLYTPLQRLDNCEKTFPRCYPKTSEYYQKLLNNKLNFIKVAEFTSYPRFCLLPDMCYMIRDDSSDESFTVYDHPQIMIFKKI
ncbi:hypothetical protein CO051_05590 [Candidatus Roizmanbacteria bacterium CG_4_9_14_0_2_um_filter_39_13]|uniref:Glycosyltransferase RgtA/B/C/D-like domain-containing protein n=2 Tax=Candidatus Roizmaniibacteriota TaxID=1752723 RepID=A0A2M8EX62_9BACT|nr:MAG: hypothetical protein COY15_04800 [Candidatus Roizmanbacteria bacterium CG_4_10_14_0_2_um_filter_39_12]PJC30458.1 MAG: hypothetical protein CO051_05590 [Candidatus Roizmanbacteria bacterium CG_4_9_14_0_2_um_filter_39_13]PJE61658.1 MAG: hypothetical protein COU87_03410 [Candidatus Roizmanbacteria bacterium CG10_big_fil_rev_8_21_14_0_10_39_12]